MNDFFPDWLFKWIVNALIGEIYPEIRAIAVSYSKDNVLKLRYYLDRKPTDFDDDSIDIVATNILANSGHNTQVKDVATVCVHSEENLGLLDTLDGLIYARREWVD